MDGNAPPRRSLAAFCSFLLVICVLAARPFAEVGINDDFSYIRSARTLAQTGHIAYYGWSSAMLGAQLAAAALFIKLFGFSFTITRSSVLLIAALTAFFFQRTSVRLGLSNENATFATLALVLSPLFLPLSFSFMTDITALFAIVLCLYCCLRVLQTQVQRERIAWLIAAALASTVLGTARQTGWLGVLLLVPCTFWLIRRRNLPLLPLLSLWLACGGFIGASLLWFSHQMYTTHETAPNAGATHNHTLDVAVAFLRILLNMGFLLLPVLIAFLPPMRNRTRSRAGLIALASLLLTALLLLRPHSFAVQVLLAPSSANGSYVTPRGILDIAEIGVRPLVLPQSVRTLLTIAIFIASLAFLATLLRKHRPARSAETDIAISWRKICFVLGPFLSVYGLFLAFRAASDTSFDRYLLPTFAITLILGVRFYQETIAPRLPVSSYVVLILYASFGIAATHDLFATERARLDGAAELRTAGLRREDFYEGFGYDGWTQIDAQGYVAAGGITLPPSAPPYDASNEQFRPCGYTLAHYFPAIHAQYALSYDDKSCGEPSPFAPVHYRTWLPPYSHALYIRKLPATAR